MLFVLHSARQWGGRSREILSMDSLSSASLSSSDGTPRPRLPWLTPSPWGRAAGRRPSYQSNPWAGFPGPISPVSRPGRPSRSCAASAFLARSLRPRPSWCTPWWSPPWHARLSRSRRLAPSSSSQDRRMIPPARGGVLRLAYDLVSVDPLEPWKPRWLLSSSSPSWMRGVGRKLKRSEGVIEELVVWWGVTKGGRGEIIMRVRVERTRRMFGSYDGRKLNVVIWLRCVAAFARGREGRTWGCCGIRGSCEPTVWKRLIWYFRGIITHIRVKGSCGPSHQLHYIGWINVLLNFAWLESSKKEKSSGCINVLLKASVNNMWVITTVVILFASSYITQYKFSHNNINAVAPKVSYMMQYRHHLLLLKVADGKILSYTMLDSSLQSLLIRKRLKNLENEWTWFQDVTILHRLTV